MEIEIAMDRKLIAQYALVIYGYEKDRIRGAANSIDHYIMKHRIDGKAGSSKERRSPEKHSAKFVPLSSRLSKPWSTFPTKCLPILLAPRCSGGAPGVPRHVFFTKETGLRSGTYPLPATLFLVVNRTLHTWALSTAVRPEPRAPVYHSPFFNVYEDGACCMGNIDLPQNASPGDISEWEEAFFDGACNGHIAPKLQGIDPYDLWKTIKGKKEFPQEYLVPCGTVEDVIQSMAGRRETWTQI